MLRSFILVLACVILAACGGEPTRNKRPADMTMEQAQRHLDECQEQASHVWASQSCSRAAWRLVVLSNSRENRVAIRQAVLVRKYQAWRAALTTPARQIRSREFRLCNSSKPSEKTGGCNFLNVTTTATRGIDLPTRRPLRCNASPSVDRK